MNSTDSDSIYIPLCNLMSIFPQVLHKYEPVISSGQNFQNNELHFCFIQTKFYIAILPLGLLVFSLPLVIYSLDKFKEKNYFKNASNNQVLKHNDVNLNSPPFRRTGQTQAHNSILNLIKYITNLAIIALWLVILCLNIINLFISYTYETRKNSKNVNLPTSMESDKKAILYESDQPLVDNQTSTLNILEYGGELTHLPSLSSSNTAFTMSNKSATTSISSSIYSWSLSHNQLYLKLLVPLIYTCSYMFSFYIHYYVKKTDQKRSPILFLFYLISSINCIINLIITLKQKTILDSINSESSNYATSIAYILTSLLLNFILLIAHSVSESTRYHLNERVSQTGPRKICPEMYVSWPNCLTFQWFTPIINQGYKQTLEEDHLWELNDNDLGNNFVYKLENNWIQELENSKILGSQPPSLTRALIKTYGLGFASACCFELLTDVLLFTQPLILKYMITFVKSDQSKIVGFSYAILMYWR